MSLKGWNIVGFLIYNFAKAANGIALSTELLILIVFYSHFHVILDEFGFLVIGQFS